jgi:hypothetical protein
MDKELNFTEGELFKESESQNHSIDIFLVNTHFVNIS